VVIVDEVGTEAEALACRTIAERGVTLIATAHGCFLENLIKNPMLSDLIGGVLGGGGGAFLGCRWGRFWSGVGRGWGLHAAAVCRAECSRCGRQKKDLLPSSLSHPHQRNHPHPPPRKPRQNQTQGDEEATRRGCKKSILERRAPPTFPVTIEMRARGSWVAHDTAASVDALLSGKVPDVQLRCSAATAADPAAAAAAGPSPGGSPAASMASISYDCVDDALAAGLFGEPTSDHKISADSPAHLPTAEQLLALVAAAAATSGGSATGSLSGSMDGLGIGDLPGADPRVWVEKLRGLPEDEALRQLSLLRYMGGDVGMLRPKGRGGFMGSAGAAREGQGVCAGGAGKKKTAKRGAAARGARR